MKRALMLLGLLAGGGAAAAAVGFVWFVAAANRSSPPPPHADGIVVLTGGAGRVETALHLLAGGRAGKLLVSGTGGNTDLATLAHLAGVDPSPIASEVTLGRNATTTRGNADETAAWAKANDIHSLIVVTALYHMPRALTEIARAAPRLTLYPVPVTPPLLRERRGQDAKLRLMAEEYVKFIAASLDLTALLPERRARPDVPKEAPTDSGTHEDSARIDRAPAG